MTRSQLTAAELALEREASLRRQARREAERLEAHRRTYTPGAGRRRRFNQIGNLRRDRWDGEPLYLPPKEWG